jgi:hypothetical protein
MTGVLLGAVVFATRAVGMPLPGNHSGYQPAQPIAFSHRLHAGELQMPCLYCHSGAEKSRIAGIPAASVCMNCHKFVTAPFGAVRAEDEAATEENRPVRPIVSPELQKLYDALALDEQREPDPRGSPTPIVWTQVHNLPDFVHFDHRAHVAADVTCTTCHGAVDTMEAMRQVETLRMGWCVNCHREVNQIGVAGRPVHASIDCVTCHY